MIYSPNIPKRIFFSKRLPAKDTGSSIPFQYDATSLTNHLRKRAHDGFFPVCPGINSHLPNTRSPSQDLTGRTDAIEPHGAGSKYNLRTIFSTQCSIPVNIPDNNLRGGKDDPMFVSEKIPSVFGAEYLFFDLPDFLFVAADFFQVFANAVLEIFQRFFPFVEIIIHTVSNIL